MTLLEQQEELAGKGESQYVTQAIAALDNHEIAKLSEILLAGGEGKGANLVKRIESEQLAHKLQVAFQQGGKTPLA